jgi:chromate reductase
MSTPLDVVAIVGSLRRASLTRRFVRAITQLAPPTLHIDIVEIGALQLYNEDIESAPTAEWQAFRERVEQADGVLFATPEYNRSVPGVLKNAIDVGSRPYGKSVWAGKPAAIVSVSPGTLGGFGANHHLRQSLVFLDMPTLQQPEAYVGGVATLLDDSDAIANESTRSYFSNFLCAFESLIQAR